MNDFSGFAKIVIIIGAALVALGLLILILGKLPFLGKLPGDFSWKGKNWSVYFPLATSILLSIIISLILYFIQKINK